MAEEELPEIAVIRARLRQLPDAEILLSYATGICENCQTCGCGEQQEPVPIPAAIAKVMSGQPVEFSEMAALLSRIPSGALLPKFMKGMFGRGRSNGHQPGSSETAAEGGDPAGGDLAGVPAAGFPDQEGGSGSGDGGEGAPGPV